MFLSWLSNFYLFNHHYFSFFCILGKGYISRQIAMRERQNELMFVGMQPRKDTFDMFSTEVNIAYLKRKQVQAENKE